MTIEVSEPNHDDALSMLRGIKDKYELHHGVKIQDEALVVAVTLSRRYIHDRFLPDKAIDLIDEVASRIRCHLDVKPVDLVACERQIMATDIELKALSKEGENKHLARRKKLQDGLLELRQQQSLLTERWQEEKAIIQTRRQLKARLDQAKQECDVAKRSGELARLSELQYGIIPSLENKLWIVPLQKMECWLIMWVRMPSRKWSQNGHISLCRECWPQRKSAGPNWINH